MPENPSTALILLRSEISRIMKDSGGSVSFEEALKQLREDRYLEKEYGFVEDTEKEIQKSMDNRFL